MHFFCHQKNLWKKFCRKNGFCVLFVAKTIYALCLESFWALKVASRTVQTFWASACPLEKHAAPLRPTNQPPSPAPIKVQNCMAHAERKWHMAQRTNARNTYIFFCVKHYSIWMVRRTASYLVALHIWKQSCQRNAIGKSASPIFCFCTPYFRSRRENCCPSIPGVLHMKTSNCNAGSLPPNFDSSHICDWQHWDLRRCKIQAVL